jgi:uroporphyrinogen III methyltransferase/synthase
MKKGKVYIIGVGPGDYKLLTLHAVEYLSKADVIVYDRLINPKVLKYARQGAELIYVGKEPGFHPIPQTEINAILIAQASAGREVARVKGGDPFLFGRGGEEAEALAANGIEFVVVPGISSAMAVPAYAGIPLTHRDYSSAVHILTGHERDDKAGATGQKDDAIDYELLAKTTGTLVFLMGVKNLAGISRRLIDHGKAPATPVVVIEKGTTVEQRVVAGTLENIAGEVVKAGVQSPAVTVIGPVTGLKDKLAWVTKRPLWGKRILVTRSRAQAGKLVEQIEWLGGEVVELPVIKICEPEDFTLFDTVLERIKSYSWLLFTSVNGVNAFFDRLRYRQRDIRELYGIRLGAVGATTAEELTRRGLNLDFMPQAYTATDLSTGLLELLKAGDRVLLTRGDLAVNREPEELSSQDLANGLRSKDIQVDDLIVYRTIMEEQNPAEVRSLLEAGQLDCLTFTSSSTVRNCITQLGETYLCTWLAKLPQTKVACIGPVTAATAAAYGIRVDIQADTFTLEGLVKKIVELLNQGSKEKF